MSLLLSLQVQRQDFALELDTALPSSGISAICGPSGSGKTSVLRCIAGLDRAPEAMVQFKGKDWQGPGQWTPPEKRGIGMVFQDARLFPHLNVLGNLNYARRRRFHREGPSHDDICNWLQIRPLLNRGVSKLSGGEQKRVAIARALIRHPQLLLMDEPLSGLHDSAREQMLDVLEGLPSHLDIPIIYVSHSFHEVSRLADHILLLEDGQLRGQGDLVEMSSHLDLPLSQQQDAGAVLPAKLESQDTDYKLSRIALNDQCQLHIVEMRGAPGQALRVYIPARDVSISLNAATDSSILNILPCTIDSMKQISGAQLILRLRLNGGDGDRFLLAKITRKSADNLKLAQGQAVFAQIKSVALVNQAGHS